MRALIRARKRFGQHFLHDPACHRAHRRRDRSRARRCRGGDRSRSRRTDRGGCWRPAAPLDAIEIDRDLARRSCARASPRSPASCCTRPTRSTMDWRALAAARGARLRLIGNLPYNISTPLLFRLLEAADAIARHALHAAEGGGRSHRRGAGQRRLRPPDGDARPARQRQRACSMSAPAPFSRRRGSPRAWCACVVLPQTPDWARSPLYAAIVAAAFGQRRKTLRNALARYLPRRAHPRARASTLEPAPRRLSAAQFGALAQAAAACELH